MIVTVIIAVEDMTAPTVKSSPPPISTNVCPTAAKLKSKVNIKIVEIALMFSAVGTINTVNAYRAIEIITAIRAGLFRTNAFTLIEKGIPDATLLGIFFPPL